MANTFDLVAEDYAMVKLTAEDTFKVRMIKRKDRQSFLDMQKKAKDGSLGENYDIVEMIAPYVEDGNGKRFREVAQELTLFQLQRLAETFFVMNGQSEEEAKKALETTPANE